MCMRDDPRVTRTGVTSEEKQKILELHNEARANVQPEGTDLTTLVRISMDMFLSNESDVAGWLLKAPSTC